MEHRVLKGFAGSMLSRGDCDRLFEAAKNGSVDELHQCVVGSAGSAPQNPWDPSNVDKHGNSVLAWCAGGGHVDALKYLFSLLDHYNESCISTDDTDEKKQSYSSARFDVNHRNKNGRQAVHWAARNGKLETLQYLVSKGGSVNATTNDGTSVFHWACFGGDLSTMKWLLAQDGVDLMALNNFGCGAAHWAATGGKLEALQFLWAKAGRQVFEIINNSEHGALNKAVHKGHRACVEWMLLVTDGPLLVDQLHMKDRNGLDLVQLANAAGHKSLVHLLKPILADQSDNTAV